MSELDYYNGNKAMQIDATGFRNHARDFGNFEGSHP